MKKETIASTFDRAAATYGTGGSSFFSLFGKRLVELSPIRPGQTALDVATGKGAVLLPLAETLGPKGHITGIDISPQMLAAATPPPNATLLQMDGEHLSFEDATFDAVFCGFALFFFPSLHTALSEFHRVLKPGGHLAVSIWGKKPHLSAWVAEHTPPSNLRANDLFDSTSLRSVLERAHFTHIDIIEEKTPITYPSAQAWWESLWGHGTRAGLEKLPADALASLREKAIDYALDNLTETFEVIYGVATK